MIVKLSKACTLYKYNQKHKLSIAIINGIMTMIMMMHRMIMIIIMMKWIIMTIIVTMSIKYTTEG